MLTKLEQPITLDAAAIKSSNLCDRFSETDLKRIGEECWAGYTRDEFSRGTWLKRNEAGMDLALQIQKDKTFPWPDSANVAFPLVTIAAQQFHARAYPAIVDGPDVVKCEVFGSDETGEKTAHADRVGTHMSWQLLQQDKAWEEQEDKAILNLSIVGTNFKKSYFSASRGHNVSELVLAKNLVLDYWAKSVEDCPRKTQYLPTFRNEVYENVMRETWRDILKEPWYQGTPVVTRNVAQTNQDNRQGVMPPAPDDTASFMFLEQHCSMDLDEDGYAEPYIITFDRGSKTVVRIVTRFDRESDIERATSGKRRGQILSIKAWEYFTKKTFIPSPDGGIYDIGFGVFLGPLNEAVNSLVNMLLDCGTMQTTGGGFLGRGAKIRGGAYTFAPFEWKRVDSTGDDLRKSIFPLTVNEPSQVLFLLLNLLINYTSRISGTTDMMVGENPGQNTPAQTAQTMVEQGSKIYTAIFKRVWRASKEEFQKLFRLNGRFLPMDREFPGGATREDYLGNGEEIAPVADPNITSDTQRVQLATAVKQSAMTTPGYNRDEVEKRWLKAMKVQAIDSLFPGTNGAPPPEDPKVTIAKMKEQGNTQRFEAELQVRNQEFVITMMEEQRLNNAKIIQLTAQAAKLEADAQSEQQYAQVATINAMIGEIKARNEHLNSQIDHLLRAAEIESKHQIATTKKEAVAA